MALLRPLTGRLVALAIVLNIPTLLLLSNSYQILDKALMWYHGTNHPTSYEPEVIPFPQSSQGATTVTEIWSTLAATSTMTVSHTPTSVVSVKPPGPAFCDICTSEDPMCTLYGEHNLARSRAYEGANARFRRVIANAQAGKPTKIGIIGGSVTDGHGLRRNHIENWTVRFLEAWKDIFPQSATTLINGAVPATGTDYYSMCFGLHVDDDVDLVIVELLINDQRVEKNAISYEWLIRGLLALPNNPAVLNLHTIGLSFDYITTGGDLHTPVAEYYDSPVISLRNMLLPHILEHEDLEEYYFATARDGTPDLRHINVHGHKVMADLLVAYTQRQVCAVEKTKAMPMLFSSNKTIPGTNRLETIPRLRMFQKYNRETVTGPVTPVCQSIRTKDGLAPIESRGWRKWSYQDQPEKPYLVANEPGSTVKFELIASLLGRVRITHLRSKTFGLGDAWCWLDDDREHGKRVVSWWNVNDINIAFVTTISENAIPGKHILSCEVLQDTSDPGGGHEFRLIAVDAA